MAPAFEKGILISNLTPRGTSDAGEGIVELRNLGAGLSEFIVGLGNEAFILI
jgi:hypothetical protein